MAAKLTKSEQGAVERLYQSKSRKIYAKYNNQVTEVLRIAPLDASLRVEKINDERAQIIYELECSMFPNRDIKKDKT